MTAARARWLAWTWTAAVFVGCSLPGVHLPDVPVVPTDKLAHVALFAPWAWLWAHVWPRRPWTVAVWGVAFGVWIEVWQSVAPLGRTGDPLDAVADAAGLALGLAAAALAARRRASAPIADARR